MDDEKDTANEKVTPENDVNTDNKEVTANEEVKTENKAVTLENNVIANEDVSAENATEGDHRQDRKGDEKQNDN